MDLRQLQHFLAVAEEQHFTRAARRVRIVQSALSASVRALEEELGTPLFVRSTRQVRLTPAGAVLVEKARAVLDAVREARAAVAAVAGLQRGRLSIGTVQSLAAFVDLPSLLAEFHARHPGIEVHLCQGSARHLSEKIAAGALDLAFLPLCAPPPGVATRLIACDALVLVCAPGHPLAGRAAVPVEALGGLPFVDFEADRGTRRLVDRLFAEAGVERRTAFEVSDLETLLQLVGRGLGIALVPEAIALSRSCLGMARLAGPEVCWELVAAFTPGSGGGREPSDPQKAEPAGLAARHFLALLTDSLRAAEDAGTAVALAY